jgi:hydroxymethylpyrimidine pyrophosphatase-like HAD family hydrolase
MPYSIKTMTTDSSVVDFVGRQARVSEVSGLRPDAGSEERFYSSYEWALDPVLSVRDLFEHLRESLNQLNSLHVPWQVEECKANIYLFASAITCTVDDYLGEPPRDVSRISRKFPGLRIPLFLVQKIINVVYRLGTFPQKLRTARWRRTWTSNVDAICELLARTGKPGPQQLDELRRSIEICSAIPLPRQLLNRRMQLPSGYRSQDLAHHDAFSLAKLFTAAQVNRRSPLLIIGPRSMGAYFAPAAKAKLSELGWTSVSWCTIRPKKGISPWEESALKALHSPDAQVLVIDESPNTGNTFLLMVNLLRKRGVSPNRICLLAAMHPARPDWRLPDTEETRGINLIRLEANALHKNRLLEPSSVQPLLASYFQALGWDDAQLVQSSPTGELNARLEEHFKDGFQCRLKRVFDVRLVKNGAPPVFRRVLAKSVGWGWLGYQAFFAGKQLAEFVPALIGLREGLVYMDWLDHAESRSTAPPIKHLAAYVAARAKKLLLKNDPTFAISPGYGWTGWSVLIDSLRRAYGPIVGRMRVSALHRNLKRYVCRAPALIDGQMNPCDWIQAQDSFCKADYEHHNFGRTELYIVDPAYDLASAVFEFHLSPNEEQELIAQYVQSSGDSTVAERILLWKVVRGVVEVERATAALGIETRSAPRMIWHERLVLARNFLVHHMNRFSASLLPHRLPSQWTRRLIFLDLDGVFDSDVMDFPQATTSSLIALSRLQRHGFSVILNTARSVTDVRQYCEAYGLPGGVAESGCVFVDAVAHSEISLIDPEDTEKLSRCKAAIQSLPGVFIDPNYRTAVRAFRYHRNRTQGLSESEIRGVLEREGLDRLTFLPTYADTTILPNNIGKGSGLLWAKQYLRFEGEPVVAIGDNDQDLDMFRAADLAFAPANCSEAVREFAAASKCRLTQQPNQRGLLEAVMQVLHADGQLCEKCDVRLMQADGCGALFQKLMEVTERPKSRKFLSILNWRSL